VSKYIAATTVSEKLVLGSDYMYLCSKTTDENVVRRDNIDATPCFLKLALDLDFIQETVECPFRSFFFQPQPLT
jgi:hypothetical protein